MYSVFSENPVLSLEVQAKAPQKEVERMNRFVVLVTHFFRRFFDNPLTSLDDENATRVIQAICAVAVPGLMFAMSLIPSYFRFPPPFPAPPRGFWPRVSDHYFYVLYTAVVTGAVTVFEWDMLFPDKIDILVLTPLPVLSRKLFTAKIVSLSAFLSLFLAGSSILGAVFLPAIADEPSYFRHLAAHIIAVAASGTFATAFFVALESVLLNLLGERIFSRISSVLQALVLTGLLIVLFLFPLLSHNIRILLLSGSHVMQYFPPFWFLGLYQLLLEGASALPVFHSLAITSGLALLAAVLLACVTYPLAYRRKTRSLIEGFVAKNRRNWFAETKNKFLHCTVLHRPRQRAVYHFISQTLKCAPQHRVYLSIYAGIGLALIIADSVTFKLANGQVGFVFSEKGLHTAVPLAAFWLIVGLKAAFTVPFELTANWPFHVIGIRPDHEHIVATQRWTLLRALAVTTVFVFLGAELDPATLGTTHAMVSRLFVAQGISLLLVDIFFLQFMAVPLAAPLAYSKRNIAFALAAFLVLFQGYIETTVSAEAWLQRSTVRLVIAVILIAVIHLGLQYQQRKMIRERASLPQDMDLEDFPQRLGLS
ncbi:MAG TPA: hypothetical protein VHT24_14485 [Pseudacidobacterium sp.]|jgi:hypothetical protein|nr:hypothetical protein [Pseudacidobacterium sp.]